MKTLIAAFALVFSFTTNANLAPKIKCVANVLGSDFEISQPLKYRNGGAAINPHFLTMVGEIQFTGFIEGSMPTSAYQGLPFMLSIHHWGLNKTLVEKHVVLYSNTLDYTVTAKFDDVTATLTCQRFQ